MIEINFIKPKINQQNQYQNELFLYKSFYYKSFRKYNAFSKIFLYETNLFFENYLFKLK
jgi:hypothetical protein